MAGRHQAVQRSSTPDGDGQARPAKELSSVLEAHGYPAAVAATLTSELDFDSDGHISFDEWRKGFYLEQPLRRQAAGRRDFLPTCSSKSRAAPYPMRRIDAISVEQLQKVVSHIKRQLHNAEGWTDIGGNVLTPAVVISRARPLATSSSLLPTSSRSPFVELVAGRAQPPTFFVSHWWGELRLRLCEVRQAALLRDRGFMAGKVQEPGTQRSRTSKLPTGCVPTPTTSTTSRVTSAGGPGAVVLPARARQEPRHALHPRRQGHRLQADLVHLRAIYQHDGRSREEGLLSSWDVWPTALPPPKKKRDGEVLACGLPRLEGLKERDAKDKRLREVQVPVKEHRAVVQAFSEWSRCVGAGGRRRASSIRSSALTTYSRSALPPTQSTTLSTTRCASRFAVAGLRAALLNSKLNDFLPYVTKGSLGDVSLDFGGVKQFGQGKTAEKLAGRAACDAKEAHAPRRRRHRVVSRRAATAARAHGAQPGATRAAAWRRRVALAKAKVARPALRELNLSSCKLDGPALAKVAGALLKVNTPPTCAQSEHGLQRTGGGLLGRLPACRSTMTTTLSTSSVIPSATARRSRPSASSLVRVRWSS